MGGKSDIVEQALKLTAGGADEAAPFIPKHLQDGFKVEAAPSASPEASDLVNYLNTRSHLPFDKESLANRRADLGYDVDAFHGSPRDIEGFSNRYSAPEGYWGGHHYFTTSPLDASVNYATPQGSDLVNRMGVVEDEVLDNFHPDDVINWYAEKYGQELQGAPTDPKIVKEYASDMARQALGIQNEGTVYPVALRMKNPVVINSPNQTFWGYDTQFDEAGDIVSEGGKAQELLESTRDAMANYGVDDREAEDIVAKLYEEVISSGGIDALTYRNIVANNLHYAQDMDGRPASAGHVMADAFQRMGYDSIDMSTDVFAPRPGRIGMVGTGGDTRHYILFDPKNVRSRFGAFDPFKAGSERLSDASGGRVERDGYSGRGRVIGDLARNTVDLLGPAERKGLAPLTPLGSGYKGVVGKPGSVKLPFIGEAEAKPIPQIMDAATEYLKKRGISGSHELAEYPRLDEEFAGRVAEAYKRMRHDPNDTVVRRAYDAMAQETIDQLRMAEDLGIDFAAIRGKDPYAASPSLGYADIAERGNLYFFPTDAGFGTSIDFDPSQNPLLKRIGRVGDLDDATVNDAFRIVHDLYGHYGPGNPFFRAPGEERAYLLHRRMYSPDALPAMTSETRGQNSWLNYGPHGPRNRNAASEDTVFADQKTGVMEPFTYLEKADGGAVDDDIADAVRLAKDVGGGTTPVMMEDAKGNKYDAQGNLIPPTAPGPNPARADAPQAVAQRAVDDPATYDALMGYYAVPDRDIVDYEATRDAVAAQPRETQQMTHVGAKPRREVTVDMPLLGGEYSMGTAPYDVASGMSGVAQTAYDLKTAPFYAVPFTAPIAAGMDLAEGLATNDPLTASLAIAFGPGSKYAKAAGIGAVNYFMDPAQAEAGPARWFSKAVDAARNIPMNKMTGEQALAMLRKGVSPEELKWIGADRFLPGEESITKQGLIDYLEKNRVGTKDVVLGGNKPTRRADVEPTPTASAPYEEEWNRIKAESLGQIERARQAREMGDLAKSDAIKAAWITNQSRLQDLREKMVDATIEEMGGLGEPLRYGPGSRYGDKYVTRGGQDYRETLITLPTSEYGKLYKSGHWEDYPNVVGHIRTQILDVTPPGSNRPYKAFNVDEAQSDYAKSGREKGFVTPEDKANFPKLVNQYSDLGRQRREVESIIANGDDASPEVQAAIVRATELNRQMNELSDRMTAIRSDGIPPAPYVTSTQNWTDLSIKKALDQAMDAGADYFTYTPGEAQAERYSLTEAIGQINATPTYDGKIHIEALSPDMGSQVMSKAFDPDKLDEVVGRELAQKIRNQVQFPQSKPGYAVWNRVSGNTSQRFDTEEEALRSLETYPESLKKNLGVLPLGERIEGRGTTLSGLDLKVGGEGMKDYYDNIYKKRVEKVVKDATGKKVQWEVIPVQTADGPRDQLGFRLTDDFQNARFSDFNKGGRVTGRGKYADSDAVNRALALTSEV